MRPRSPLSYTYVRVNNRIAPVAIMRLNHFWVGELPPWRGGRAAGARGIVTDRDSYKSNVRHILRVKVPGGPLAMSVSLSLPVGVQGDVQCLACWRTFTSFANFSRHANCRQLRHSLCAQGKYMLSELRTDPQRVGGRAVTTAGCIAAGGSLGAGDGDDTSHDDVDCGADLPDSEDEPVSMDGAGTGLDGKSVIYIIIHYYTYSQVYTVLYIIIDCRSAIYIHTFLYVIIHID